MALSLSCRITRVDGATLSNKHSVFISSRCRIATCAASPVDAADVSCPTAVGITINVTAWKCNGPQFPVQTAPISVFEPLSDLADDETDRIITDPESQTRTQQDVRERLRELMQRIQERLANRSGSSNSNDASSDSK